MIRISVIRTARMGPTLLGADQIARESGDDKGTRRQAQGSWEVREVWRRNFRCRRLFIIMALPAVERLDVRLVFRTRKNSGPERARRGDRPPDRGAARS